MCWWSPSSCCYTVLLFFFKYGWKTLKIRRTTLVMTDTGRCRSTIKTTLGASVALPLGTHVMKQSSTIHTRTYVGLSPSNLHGCVPPPPPPHPDRNFWRNACKGGLQGLPRFLYNVQQTALTPLSLCCCLDRCSIVPCWGGRGVSYQVLLL